MNDEGRLTHYFPKTRMILLLLVKLVFVVVVIFGGRDVLGVQVVEGDLVVIRLSMQLKLTHI